MKPTVPQVLPLVWAYYLLPGNGAGGNFHVVLDDGNIRKCDVEYCLQTARDKNDSAGVALGEILLLMSKTQLKKLSIRSHPMNNTARWWINQIFNDVEEGTK